MQVCSIPGVPSPCQESQKLQLCGKHGVGGCFAEDSSFPLLWPPRHLCHCCLPCLGVSQRLWRPLDFIEGYPTTNLLRLANASNAETHYIQAKNGLGDPKLRAKLVQHQCASSWHLPLSGVAKALLPDNSVEGAVEYAAGWKRERFTQTGYWKLGCIDMGGERKCRCAGEWRQSWRHELHPTVSLLIHHPPHPSGCGGGET